MNAAQDTSWWKEFDEILALPNFEAFIASEHRATAIDFFNGNWLSGLFQTEDYAQAASKVVGVMPRTIKIRMLRQWHVFERPDRPRIRLVLAEHLLYRELDGAEMLREQLLHVKTLAEQPNISVFILPMASKFSQMQENFIIHRVAEGNILYIDHSIGMYRSTSQRELANYAISFEELLLQAWNAEDSIKKLLKRADEILYKQPLD